MSRLVQEAERMDLGPGDVARNARLGARSLAWGALIGATAWWVASVPGLGRSALGGILDFVAFVSWAAAWALIAFGLLVAAVTCAQALFWWACRQLART